MVSVKMDVFEGPLDLLLHLIHKNQIDIYDIPIALLADQYIAHLDLLETADMEGMSEFLVMAATLLEMKSALLLPQKQKEETEEDPKEELIRRLIEYKKFKQIAEEFRTREEQAEQAFYKSFDETLPTSEFFFPPPTISDLLSELSLEYLHRAFEEVLTRKEQKTDTVRSGFRSVERDLYTIEEKTTHIVNLLFLYNKVRFSEIFNPNARKIEKVVTFLALLELIKTKKICIMQECLFDDILLTRNDDSNDGKPA